MVEREEGRRKGKGESLRWKMDKMLRRLLKICLEMQPTSLHLPRKSTLVHTLAIMEVGHCVLSVTLVIFRQLQGVCGGVHVVVCACGGCRGSCMCMWREMCMWRVEGDVHVEGGGRWMCMWRVEG